MDKFKKAGKILNQGAQDLASGKTDKAIKSFLKAIKINNQGSAHFNLALAYQQKGEVKKAIKAFEKTIKLSPNDYEAYNNLGNLYVNQGQVDQATRCFQKAVSINPLLFEGFYNLGVCYREKGELKKAIKNYETSLKIYKNNTNALNNLAMIYEMLGDRQKSMKYLKKALKISPENPMILVNLGADLIASDVEKARECFAKAVIVDDNNAMAHYNLGVSLRLLGKNVEAIQRFQKALEIDPEMTTVYKELYLQIREICDWEQAEKIAKQIKKLTDKALKKKTLPDETPFASMLKDENPKRNYQLASAWSRYIKDKVSSFSADRPFTFNKKKSKKIRIGYLSADFKNHATAHLIMGLLELHDRKKFEIFIYSYGPNDRTHYRKETEKLADKFTDIINLPDFESAKLIYKDKIDILVDLKGHTGSSRFEIPALRPAPVQVNYLGFPGTTGADFIDYFITDKIVTPTREIPLYSEKLVFLPYSYQVNDNQQPISNNLYQKVDFGLPKNGFIFCSFNMTYKIGPKVFDSWMKILKAVPGSVLWLLEKTGQDKINLKKEAKKRGVDPSRLIFSIGIRKELHLARLKLADLCLDTFNCNGMTTTSDSLWAGVPVITLKGNHFASRVSTSLLTAIGLPELITHSPKEYENLAIKLAKDPKKLDTLRSKLNANRLTKPLFDTQKFTQYLEEAYSQMWKTYSEGKKPANIVIKP